MRTGCFGLCELGPICIIYPEGSFYARLTEDHVAEIVEEHLLKGRICTKYLYSKSIAEDNTTKPLMEIDFYKKQRRIARTTAASSSRNIDEYAFDGYRALAKCLTELTPKDVVDTIISPGCAAAAARATGRKWFAQQARASASSSPATDEGDRRFHARSEGPTACWRPWPSRGTPSGQSGLCLHPHRILSQSSA